MCLGFGLAEWMGVNSPTKPSSGPRLRSGRSNRPTSPQPCWLSSNCVAGTVGLGILGRQQSIYDILSLLPYWVKV